MNVFNFTENTRRTLGQARVEASQLHHEYIGTEHILLAMIAVPDSMGGAILQTLGDPAALRQRVLDVVQRGRSDTPTGPDLPYTSRAKKILELAMHAAHDLHHSYTGSAHLLIGMLAEERGIAAQILAEGGITLPAVRAELTRLLGPVPLKASETPSTPKSEPTANARRVALYTIALELADGTTTRYEFTRHHDAIRFLMSVGE